jgi:hypothetical protein
MISAAFKGYDQRIIKFSERLSKIDRPHFYRGNIGLARYVG